MEDIRFAVVGCGHIGKRHLEMIAREKGGRIAAICDVRPRAELGLPIEYDNLPFFQTIEELLRADINFDVACVCVPNGLHADLGEQVLRSGHHAVIEKPMVLHLADGDRLHRAETETGKRIFGVLQNRYTPSSRWLKQILREGLLGEIFNVRLDCLWNRDERYYRPRSWHGSAELDGGTLYTQYSHFIDLLYWFFGDIAEINHASFRNYNHRHLIEFEDSGNITFRFLSGADGQLNYSTAVFGQNMEVALTVLGSRGAVRIAGPFLNNVEHCVIADYFMPEVPASRPGNQYGGYSGSAQNHHLVIRNIIAALQNRPAEVVSLNDGLAVVRLIDRIYRLKPETL